MIHKLRVTAKIIETSMFMVYLYLQKKKYFDFQKSTPEARILMFVEKNMIKVTINYYAMYYTFFEYLR